MNATHDSAPDAVVLRTEHLGRRVGDVAIVSDVSLDVRRAELRELARHRLVLFAGLGDV